MALSFSVLDNSRVDEAFVVLQAVAHDIESKGRSQRISSTTLETYLAWQSEASNYIVTDEPAGQIVGLVTLCDETLHDWPNYSHLGRVPMLRALATHPDYTGKGIGEFAVRNSIETRGHQISIYLDCVSDFLPSYYARLGFTAIARQVRDYGDNCQFDITLMKYCHQKPGSA